MSFLLKRLVIMSVCPLVLVSMLQCSRQGGHPVGRETFVTMYAELLLIGEECKTDTTLAKSRTQELYQKFSVTEVDFRKTVARYNEDPNQWREIYADVIKILEQKKYQSPPHPSNR
jgi:hypothetical protein